MTTTREPKILRFFHALTSAYMLSDDASDNSKLGALLNSVGNRAGLTPKGVTAMLLDERDAHS